MFLADEDDCSAKDSALYAPDVDSPFGVPTSFRCFEYGVLCDGASPARAAATLDPVGGPRACQPAGAIAASDGATMWHPQRYVDFVKGLKRDAASIVVAGILGDVEPVSTRITNEGNPVLNHSCGFVTNLAHPAIRLGAFVDAFGGRGRFESFCHEDLSDAVGRIGDLIADTSRSRA